MFLDIGAQELFIILIILLLVFGPNRLPGIGRALGRTVREFRQTKGAIEKEVKEITGKMPLGLDRLLNIMKMITGRKRT